jgi:hypothetical protein
MNDSQNGGGQISGERRAMYYLGMGLIVIGFLVFISVFFSAATSMGDLSMMEGGPNPGELFPRALIGMGLIVVGAMLRGVGARGAAGSGVVLDPDQARRDLEPWSRMAGGMLKDAVDESGLKADEKPGDAELAFDEKLRRLEQLRQDGLLTEAEYSQKRAEVLKKDW